MSKLTDPYIWSGKLRDIEPIVSNLIRFGKLNADSMEIKYCTPSGALRISDYIKRRTAQPGEYFWMWGEHLRSGDMHDYREDQENDADAPTI